MTRLCSVEGCGERHHAKALCGKHYAERENKRRYREASANRHAKHGAINDMSEVEASYIAGLIDADGTVTVSIQSANAIPRPLVLIVNGNMPLIEWLLETVGAGCAYRTKTKATRPDQNEANWNPVHRYQITGWKALALLEATRPFMRVKDKQADLLATLVMRGRDYNQTATPEQREQAIKVGEQVRLLNRRGVDHLANLR